MKKKTKKVEAKKTNPMPIWTLIVMAIVILITILISLAVSSILDPNWKITIDECYEETTKLGEIEIYLYSNLISRTIQISPGYSGKVCDVEDNSGACSESSNLIKLTPIYAYKKWDCSDYYNYWDGEIKISKKIEKECTKNYTLDMLGLKVTNTNYKWGFMYSINEDVNSTNVAYAILVVNKTTIKIKNISKVRQVCTSKEVDEIIYKESRNQVCEPLEYIKELYYYYSIESTNAVFNAQMNNATEVITLRVYDYVGDEGRLKNITVQCVPNLKYLNKQDLTKDWLETNCQCINFTCPEDYPFFSARDDIGDNLCYGPHSKTIAQVKCSKYKCYNYIVIRS